MSDGSEESEGNEETMSNKVSSINGQSEIKAKKVKKGKKGRGKKGKKMRQSSSSNKAEFNDRKEEVESLKKSFKKKRKGGKGKKNRLRSLSASSRIKKKNKKGRKGRKRIKVVVDDSLDSAEQQQNDSLIKISSLPKPSVERVNENTKSLKQFLEWSQETQNQTMVKKTGNLYINNALDLVKDNDQYDDHKITVKIVEKVNGEIIDNRTLVIGKYLVDKIAETVAKEVVAMKQDEKRIGMALDEFEKSMRSRKSLKRLDFTTTVNQLDEIKNQLMARERFRLEEKQPNQPVCLPSIEPYLEKSNLNNNASLCGGSCNSSTEVLINNQQPILEKIGDQSLVKVQQSPLTSKQQSADSSESISSVSGSSYNNLLSIKLMNLSPSSNVSDLLHLTLVSSEKTSSQALSNIDEQSKAISEQMNNNESMTQNLTSLTSKDLPLSSMNPPSQSLNNTTTVSILDDEKTTENNQMTSSSMMGKQLMKMIIEKMEGGTTDSLLSKKSQLK